MILSKKFFIEEFFLHSHQIWNGNLVFAMDNNLNFHNRIHLVSSWKHLFAPCVWQSIMITKCIACIGIQKHSVPIEFKIQSYTTLGNRAIGHSEIGFFSHFHKEAGLDNARNVDDTLINIGPL